MAITWNIWLSFAFFAASAIALLAKGVIGLRTGHGVGWKGITFFVLAMILCIGGNFGAYSLYSSNVSFTKSFKNPPGPSHLEPHWGADMSRGDRTKYSKMLARTSFENWGITVNYFDETGTLRPYQATDEDRAMVQWRRQTVVHLEKQTRLLEWITFGWLFVPWLGLFSGVVLGALTGRFKADAPQARSAPLS